MNMPELPEVETIVKILNRLVDGKTIDHVDVLRSETVEGDVSFFKATLKGQTINSVSRIGKFIIYHLTNENVLISHLRMEGKYFLKEKGERLTRHDLVVFYFKDGSFLTYNDTRRFGRMNVDKESTFMNNKPINNVGPDPFMMANADRLVKAFKNKRIPIKQALLDQSIMSGLGNIYVDEVLFRVKIHPLTPANAVTKKELDEIFIASKEVLSKAVESGGSTIKSYHPQEGVSGNFQVLLKAYGKEGQPCPNCGTKFVKIFVNGRGTTYCPQCQVNKAKPYVIGISGAISSGKSLAGEYFKNHGYFLLDSDQIVHDLYKDEMIQGKLIELIPELKITNGDIDRKFLKTYLVNNPSQKSKLETFIYKEVKSYIEKVIKALPKSSKIALEVPMLFQSHIDKLCDDILIIETSKNVQKERLSKRNEDYEEFLRLNKSYYLQEDKKKATAVINNDKDVASLYKNLDAYLR